MNSLPLYGYHGKILDIDLSSGDIRIIPVRPDNVFDYLGGRGLATRFFIDSVHPECDPLGEDNVIVIATSPLIGTNAPTACRGHMVFKSPLTGFLGSSNSGGSWAPGLKSCGYDALVIKGRASEPVMIDISPGKVEVLPAGYLWGRNVHETTEALSAGAEPGRRPKILCVGPAGENLVRIAAVVNDKNRTYGRSGPGAVFGSKKLKAVRVFGRIKTQVKAAENYRSGLDQALYLMKQAPITKRLLRELGTSGLIELIALISMLPHRNFQDSLHIEENLEKISGETLSRTLLERAGACLACPIGCQRHTRVMGDGGRDEKGEGPEYETAVMMGPLCDIYELPEITRANYRCNELGIDTISFGGTLACAIELAEKGFLKPEETVGFDLRFGNSAALEPMVKNVAFRRGIGNILAEGAYRLASHYNHPELSMTVKKLEIPGYDPRASFTQALGYMTSPTGACHLRGGYAVSLAFFGGTKEIPRFSLMQSPLAIRNMQNLGIIQDSLGVCRFTGFAFSLEPWARMVSGVTGLDFSTARLEVIANRIATVERLFNLKAGAMADDDLLPERFSREPITVAGTDRTVSRGDMIQMRADYYRVRNWDQNGRPAPGLLQALNIKE
jgi:aldehyde:ferredoxin oxidoreductase